ncbi:IS4 family transposase [Limnoglobus roseus]|uniref:IS4 family transposase n=1 Tax=Limnoglobus roseus TaxID=2598579 RepID=A0A5C1AH62_9BACT|nr:IS4 family transposase [Limnoglobus roseus]QEL16298.1 IS4 family transposase [Limnoglobus roseus]
MIPSLLTALRQIRADVAAALAPASIRHACETAGHTWRDRLLDPVHLLVLQILHGNTACAHLPRLTGRSFSASAYCQARARLPLAVLRAVLARVTDAARPLADGDDGRWRGLRTFFVDGSGVSLPDTPALQAAFGQPTNQAAGCGFPVARVLILFHAGTGLLLKPRTAPLRSHEVTQATLTHAELRPGDVLVGDRAFGTFAHLAALARRGLHGVFRNHQGRIVDFRPGRPHAVPGSHWGHAGQPRSRWVRGFGRSDQLVEWYRPQNRPVWLTVAEYAAMPRLLTVRELAYRVNRPGFRVRSVTLVTTLLDATAYPADAVADRYRARWGVETDLAHWKTTLGMDVLKCETEAGVPKELTAFALVYNLVRVVMWEAARRQGVCPDRISFVDALRWLSSAPPGTPLPNLIVNPSRPDRIEPRCQKRRAKKYPYMSHARQELRRRILAERVAS